MATKKSSPTMEFVVAQLKKNPNIEYAALKAAADKKGLTIYPIVYGRAKALLGLVKISPRGSGKAKKKKKTAAAAARPATGGTRRGRGRPARSGTLDSLQSVIDEMKGLASERDRYRRALEKVADVLDEALS